MVMANSTVLELTEPPDAHASKNFRSFRKSPLAKRVRQCTFLVPPISGIAKRFRQFVRAAQGEMFKPMNAMERLLPAKRPRDQARNASLAVGLLASLGLCLAAPSAQADSGQDRLAGRRLDSASPSLKLDLDCDGKQDSAWMSTTPDAVTVHVAFGDVHRKPAALVIPVGGGSQGDLCGLPVHLELTSNDYDPTDPKNDIGPLPGFRRSKMCKSLAVVDGNCDNFNLYWDHAGQRLRWWRR